MVEQVSPWAQLAVSAAGSFGIGAIVGAAGNHLLGWHLRRRQEARELESLLFLVLSEMVSNDNFAKRWVDAQAESLRRGEEPGAQSGALRADAWEDARTRLAYLLPPKDFYPLARYYHSARRWETMPGRRASEYWKTLRLRSEVAQKRIGSEYLGKDFATGLLQEYREEVKWADRSRARPTDAARESPVSPAPTRDPTPAPVDAQAAPQEPARRSWWRRVFGG